MIINGSSNKILTNISVENYFRISDIAVNPFTNTIYVTNPAPDRDAVSVIDGTTNKVLSKILVGELPTSIAVNPVTNVIYAIDALSNKVSIIDPYFFNSSKPLLTSNSSQRTIATGAVVTNITVGIQPNDIAINPVTNTIYVTNEYEGTVAVIDGETNHVSSNIDIGSRAEAISVNPTTNIIYVINRAASTIAIINGITKNVVTGDMFTLSPFASGHIKCDGQEVPTNQYVRMRYGTKCVAEPNKDYKFSSWTENLGHNSTKTISSSTAYTSPFNSLVSTLGFYPSDNAATFNLTQYGNFTANFRQVPPPIPPEYWIPLYGVIVSSIVGWSIPSIIGWLKVKRQQEILHRYHKRINSLYEDGKLNEDDIAPLDTLRADIADAYSKGKISEQQYGNLKNEITAVYAEVYDKKIRSLDARYYENNDRLLDNIRYDIADAYSKGKISNLHYNLLKDRISSYENNPKKH